MKKIIFYFYFALALSSCRAQQTEKMEKQYIDITKKISVKNFKAVVGVILLHGDRKTYCNKYNNSPYYKFKTFDIYLDPINQFINWSNDDLSKTSSDYDKIVIQDFDADKI